LLKEAKFDVATSETNQQHLIFESTTLIGFVIAFSSVSDLLNRWKAIADDIFERYAPAFRKAGQKAWNGYLILITSDQASDEGFHALQKIEEDLTQIRKIARSNIQSADDLKAALLSILPISYIPSLQPLDIKQEIRKRAQEIPETALEEFLSNADLEKVATLLEADL
jgi:hypothetical protein